ncbi:MAG: energy transducer TonB [Bacteroidota bacterium]
MKSVINTLKMSRVAHIVILVVLISACQDQVMEEVAEAELQTVVDLPKDISEEMKTLEIEFPDEKFTYVETDLVNKDKLDEFKDLDPATVVSLHVFKGREKVGIILKSTENLNRAAEATKTGDEVFTIVEETATPPGGMNSFYQYIAQNVQYPEQARRSGVEGAVYVQFIVNMDGSLSDIKTVKGIGAGCDKEAIRVISGSSNWNPARQRGRIVKQKLILPVTFKLNPKGEQPETK